MTLQNRFYSVVSGTVQCLTPHSRIAKARRAYFGIESPAGTSDAGPTPATGRCEDIGYRAKRKLFNMEAQKQKGNMN